MKDSQFTGNNIYETIRRLDSELTEIGNAMEIVSDECGQGSLPHAILKKTYEEKRLELTSAKNIKYVAVQ